MFEKFSQKIGFTETEIIVVLFLAGTFLIGFIYIEYFKNDSVDTVNFDYSVQDSLFSYYSNTDNTIFDEQLSDEQKQKIRQEVLELTDSFVYVKKDISSLEEKSININMAGMQELILLPGIGEKTAQKIIDLRTKKGRFSSLEELLDVSGIGEVKFNKIKKFLYIK